MVLEVGDIVKIRSRSELEPLIGNMTLFSSMTKFCGKKMRIVERAYVTKMGEKFALTDSPWFGQTPVYRLENCFYYWSDKMFEVVSSLRYEVE